MRSVDPTATTPAPHLEPGDARFRGQPGRSTHNHCARRASIDPSGENDGKRPRTSRRNFPWPGRPAQIQPLTHQRDETRVKTKRRRSTGPFTRRRAPPPARLILHKPPRATVTASPSAVNAGSLPTSLRERRAQETPQARSIRRDHDGPAAGRIDKRDRPTVRGDTRLSRMTTQHHVRADRSWQRLSRAQPAQSRCRSRPPAPRRVPETPPKPAARTHRPQPPQPPRQATSVPSAALTRRLRRELPSSPGRLAAGGCGVYSRRKARGSWVVGRGCSRTSPPELQMSITLFATALARHHAGPARAALLLPSRHVNCTGDIP